MNTTQTPTSDSANNVTDAVDKTAQPGIQTNIDIFFSENRERAAKGNGAFYQIFDATFADQDNRPTKILMLYSQDAALSQRIHNLLVAGGILNVDQPANDGSTLADESTSGADTAVLAEDDAPIETIPGSTQANEG